VHVENGLGLPLYRIKPCMAESTCCKQSALSKRPVPFPPCQRRLACFPSYMGPAARPILASRPEDLALSQAPGRPSVTHYIRLFPLALCLSHPNVQFTQSSKWIAFVRTMPFLEHRTRKIRNSDRHACESVHCWGLAALYPACLCTELSLYRTRNIKFSVPGFPAK
jgi:hypothetical protein